MSAVRLAGADADAGALSRLHGLCFKDRWSSDFIASVLASPGAILAVAPDAGEIAGFILARAAADESEILTIAVRPEMRRHGIGVALVKAAARRAHELGATAMFLEVGRSNAAARALYEKLGFRKVGERPAYYRDRPGGPAEDALTLRAVLPLPLGKQPDFG